MSRIIWLGIFITLIFAVTIVTLCIVYKPKLNTPLPSSQSSSSSSSDIDDVAEHSFIQTIENKNDQSKEEKKVNLTDMFPLADSSQMEEEQVNITEKKENTENTESKIQRGLPRRTNMRNVVNILPTINEEPFNQNADQKKK